MYHGQLKNILLLSLRFIIMDRICILQLGGLCTGIPAAIERVACLVWSYPRVDTLHAPKTL